QFYCSAGGYGAVLTGNVNGFQYVNGNYLGWPGNYGFGYAGYYPWWGGVPTGTPYTGVIRVAEVTAPGQVPAADPQPAPVAPAVTQVAPAPQPAPAQMATSLEAAQQPTAPQAPVAAPVSVPTSGGGNGTTVQGTVTAVVAAPQVAPGND